MNAQNLPVMGLRRGRRGMTLIELVIVLCVMAIIVGGIWALAAVVWDHYGIDRTKTQVLTVIQNARDYYDSSGYLTRTKLTCDSDITSDLDDDSRRLIPLDMRRTKTAARGDINHALMVTSGGSFHVLVKQGTAAEGGICDHLRVRLLGLKKDDCVQILMQFPTLVPEVGVAQIGTASAGLTAIVLSNIASPGAPTLTQAKNWCSLTKDNEVQIDFKLRP